jgi:hypothetical protein
MYELLKVVFVVSSLMNVASYEQNLKLGNSVLNSDLIKKNPNLFFSKTQFSKKLPENTYIDCALAPKKDELKKQLSFIFKKKQYTSDCLEDLNKTNFYLRLCNKIQTNASLNKIIQENCSKYSAYFSDLTLETIILLSIPCMYLSTEEVKDYVFFKSPSPYNLGELFNDCKYHDIYNLLIKSNIRHKLPKACYTPKALEYTVKKEISITLLSMGNNFKNIDGTFDFNYYKKNNVNIDLNSDIFSLLISEIIGKSTKYALFTS